MLASLSEIDPISFYTSSSSGLKPKLPTTYKISPPLDDSQNPFPSLDLNNPSLPPGSDPYLDMLSDALFEGDLPESKKSESNILVASEGLVIESLAMMREEVRLEGSENPQNDEIKETQPIFIKH